MTVANSSLEQYFFAPRQPGCAFDSHGGLLLADGMKRTSIPMLDIPIPRKPMPDQLVRLTFPCAVRNVTLYLVNYASPLSTFDAPPDWILSLWYGLECMEDLNTLGAALITSDSWLEVGRVFTLSTPTLFNSIVIGGGISGELPIGTTHLSLPVRLRVLADDKFGCCEADIDYGPIGSAPQ